MPRYYYVLKVDFRLFFCSAWEENGNENRDTLDPATNALVLFSLLLIQSLEGVLSIDSSVVYSMCVPCLKKANLQCKARARLKCKVGVGPQSLGALFSDLFDNDILVCCTFCLKSMLSIHSSQSVGTGSQLMAPLWRWRGVSLHLRASATNWGGGGKGKRKKKKKSWILLHIVSGFER